MLSDRDRERAEERDENPVRWEYKARNLAKVAGIMLETDFNKLGAQGWEFVGMASGGREGYAIFKRRL
ncbi:MAG TPA: hypothetical protein VK631_17425 [Solirubrobacteraceae bacterium]|nr:hypothetical protein [Solirubrobacteraceae bacterium]